MNREELEAVIRGGRQLGLAYEPEPPATGGWYLVGKVPMGYMNPHTQADNPEAFEAWERAAAEAKARPFRVVRVELPERPVDDEDFPEGEDFIVYEEERVASLDEVDRILRAGGFGLSDLLKRGEFEPPY